MVDADMRFHYGDVAELVRAANEFGEKIIGGLCFTGDADIRPTMIVAHPEHGFQHVAKWPANALCKVEATGCAFLLIHRTVLEKMQTDLDVPGPWFDFGWRKSASGEWEQVGEDVTFCMRAASCGFDVYVHSGVKPKHMKVRPVDENDYSPPAEVIPMRGEGAQV
jgi:hypothetical protein